MYNFVSGWDEIVGWIMAEGSWVRYDGKTKNLGGPKAISFLIQQFFSFYFQYLVLIFSVYYLIIYLETIFEKVKKKKKIKEKFIYCFMKSRHLGWPINKEEVNKHVDMLFGTSI